MMVLCCLQVLQVPMNHLRKDKFIKDQLLECIWVILSVRVKSMVTCIKKYLNDSLKYNILNIFFNRFYCIKLRCTFFSSCWHVELCPFRLVELHGTWWFCDWFCKYAELWEICRRIQYGSRYVLGIFRRLSYFRWKTWNYNSTFV